MVEAPRMSMRELYSRFGAATRPPPAAPLAAPPTCATAQITVQQSGRHKASGAKSGFVDLDTKVEALVDVEAGTKPAGGSPVPPPSVKAAPPPLSRKMKASSSRMLAVCPTIQHKTAACRWFTVTKYRPAKHCHPLLPPPQIGMWVAVIVLVVCGTTAIALAASQGAKKGGSSSTDSVSTTQQADAAVPPPADVPAAAEDAQQDSPPADASADAAAVPPAESEGDTAVSNIT